MLRGELSTRPGVGDTDPRQQRGWEIAIAAGLLLARDQHVRKASAVNTIAAAATPFIGIFSF
jgi:hypothetical protein